MASALTVALLSLALACGDDGASADTDADGSESGGDTNDTTGAGPGTDPTLSTTSSMTSEGASESSGSGGVSSNCMTDAECDDGNPCNGVETCVNASACQPGAAPEGPVPCGGNGLCVDGACVPSTCGNGEIEGGEQCDDANQADYDGCSVDCRFELFFRRYELELMPSPAGSFCDRPTSVLGDILSPFALEQDNATRAVNINEGTYNAIIQIEGLDDLSGASTEEISFYSGYAVPDPAGPPWPTDGSNPVDSPFLLEAESMAGDGKLADRTDVVEVSGGVHIGGPGTSLRPVPEFVDVYGRGRFATEPAPNLPDGAPTLAEGTAVVQELLGDGPDEGFCGTLTVDFLARQPVDPSLADCLECPGISHAYTPCEGDQVTENCNSGLDPIVGGCVIGATCAAGFEVVTPTQPDVEHGGPTPLVPDEANLWKVPVEQTDGSTNGYSAYFRYRARRILVTGVEGQ